MRRIVYVLVVLAMVAVYSPACAIETCMKVKITQVIVDNDGTKIVSVVNEDGDSFMFDQVKWEAKVGQKLYMCIGLRYGKGNFWTMDDKEPFLTDKPKRK